MIWNSSFDGFGGLFGEACDALDEGESGAHGIGEGGDALGDLAVDFFDAAAPGHFDELFGDEECDGPEAEGDEGVGDEGEEGEEEE